MKRLATIVFALLFGAYPFLIYLGMARFNAKVLGGFVLFVLALRMLFLSRFDMSRWKEFIPMLVAIGAVSLFSILDDNKAALLLVPVFANGAFLATFGVTLIRPPSMIERFAALTVKEIEPQVADYCVRVTVVWCIFFVVNGLVSLYTVFFTSREFWTLYNGLISYLLIGLLAGGEWLVRKQVQARHETEKTVETSK